MAWLALQYHGPIVDAPTPKTGVLRMDGGKLILNRTPSAIHTFSWGAQTMAQFVPYRLDRVTSPHPRSGIGHIRLAGAGEDLPVRIHDVKVVSDATSFEATLEMDHGDGEVRAFLTFRSAKDGTWHLREKLVALKDVETDDIATGLVGVLNNPHWVYETGTRRIALDGTDHAVPSGTGATVEGDAKRIGIDEAVRFASDNPLHVLYQGARKAERARFTDELYLNHLGGRRSWKAGEEMSSFDVRMDCTAQ